MQPKLSESEFPWARCRTQYVKKSLHCNFHDWADLGAPVLFKLESACDSPRAVVKMEALIQ